MTPGDPGATPPKFKLAYDELQRFLLLLFFRLLLVVPGLLLAGFLLEVFLAALVLEVLLVFFRLVPAADLLRFLAVRGRLDFFFAAAFSRFSVTAA